VWSELSTIGSALTRVVVPGEQVLALAETGTYTIFHEAESVIDGHLYTATDIQGLKVSITAEDGGAVPVTPSSGKESYTLGGHSGVSVLAFDIVKPGSYRLAAAYDDGRSGPMTILAVGRNFLGRLLVTIFGAFGVGFAGFIAALVLTLVTFLRRRRMLRLRAA
jgi:hypothetical protein